MEANKLAKGKNVILSASIALFFLMVFSAYAVDILRVSEYDGRHQSPLIWDNSLPLALFQLAAVLVYFQSPSLCLQSNKEDLRK